MTFAMETVRALMSSKVHPVLHGKLSFAYPSSRKGPGPGRQEAPTTLRGQGGRNPGKLAGASQIMGNGASGVSAVL